MRWESLLTASSIFSTLSSVSFVLRGTRCCCSGVEYTGITLYGSKEEKRFFFIDKYVFSQLTPVAGVGPVRLVSPVKGRDDQRIVTVLHLGRGHREAVPVRKE